MEADVGRKKIAVVGAGVAGITSAHVLARAHDVTLFERNNYLGGHTNTITIQDGPDSGTPVDTGFIVCNERNYPCFYKFLEQLGVSLKNSDMSFTFYCQKSGLGYSGPTLRDFLRQPGNFMNLSLLKMLWEQRAFNRRALVDLQNNTVGEAPLRTYLTELRYSPYFIENYIIPLTAAIWSSSDSDALDIPASTFLEFFKNHGMLEFNKIPLWQVVCGGSKAYIDAFRRTFKGSVVLNAKIKGIERQPGFVAVKTSDGTSEKFDALVLAAHADEALQLLEDPSPQERSLLGAWHYHKNSAVLHRDITLLPPHRSLWSSWNYVRTNSFTPNSSLGISYYMNRLQGLRTKNEYIVTLNNDAQIDPTKVIYRTTYTHPHFTVAAVKTQPEIEKLNGTRSTYYCGSYLGYGFHEDAVASAVRVANKFGLSL